MKNQYNNINELIRDLIAIEKIDPNHWINKEAMYYTKKKNYDSTNATLKFIPEKLKSLHINCECGRSFQPNWLEKTYPELPFYHEKKGLFIFLGNRTLCPNCNAEHELPITKVQMKGSQNVFGDEAFRKLSNVSIMVYSFIAFSGGEDQRLSFYNDFLEIKRQIKPNEDPSKWVFHFTELKDRKFCKKDITISQNISFNTLVNGIIDLIKEHNDKQTLNVFVSTSLFDHVNNHKKMFQKVKEQTYLSAIISLIQEITANNLAPKIYFERTGNDGWATKLFNGARLTLLWQYMSHGLPVRTPEFVPPGNNFLLEIADIISYVIARYLFCIGSRAEGRILYPDF